MINTLPNQKAVNHLIQLDNLYVKCNCQHLLQGTLTCLLLSCFYRQPKTHSEHRVQKKVPREIFKTIMIAVCHTFGESLMCELA